jgi:hypothetical protein
VTERIIGTFLPRVKAWAFTRNVPAKKWSGKPAPLLPMLSEAQKGVFRAGEDSFVGMDVRMTVGVEVWHRMIMTMVPGIVLEGTFLDLGKGTPKLRHRSSPVADDVAERTLRLFVVDKVPSGGEVVQGT